MRSPDPSCQPSREILARHAGIDGEEQCEARLRPGPVHLQEAVDLRLGQVR